MITQKQINEKRIDLTVPKIGYVQLSKFSPDYDHGIYKNRPWHVVTFGRNFATVDECIQFLEEIVKNWDKTTNEEEWRPVCHAEMTHSFLSMEADLDDNCQ